MENESPIGHNRKPRAGGIAVDQLKSVIARIERLEEEKAELAADIRDIYAEAKANGYSTTAIKQIIKLRKKDVATREEEETILETYMNALGMLPLFEQADDAA